MCFAPQRRASFYFCSGQRAPHPPLYFRPSGPANHWKTQCFATCLTFRAPVPSNSFCFSFSLLLFSSVTLPISAFHLYNVGNLTSIILLIILLADTTAYRPLLCPRNVLDDEPKRGKIDLKSIFRPLGSTIHPLGDAPFCSTTHLRFTRYGRTTAKKCPEAKGILPNPEVWFFFAKRKSSQL